MAQYLPIFALLVLAIVFGLLSRVASRLLGPRNPTVAKSAPYECGIIPDREPPQRFPVKFFLVAMIFIVFDIEVIFLFPWAVVYRSLGPFGLFAIAIFAAAVFESFVYLISNGALDWGPDQAAAPGRRGRSGPHHGLHHPPCRPRGSRPRRRGEHGRGGLMAEPGGFLDKGLEGLEHNFLTGTLEELVKWARARSVMPASFGLACCAIEMMGTGGAHYDLARYGMEVFRASPRQADLMIVAGRVSQKMAPVLRQIYDQMMEPKWVISMGVCASSGGMFNNYAIVQGVDQVVPVDVYAPGCPPGPQTLLHAILTLHAKIRAGELTRRKGQGAGLVIEQRDGQTDTGTRVELSLIPLAATAPTGGD